MKALRYDDDSEVPVDDHLHHFHVFTETTTSPSITLEVPRPYKILSGGTTIRGNACLMESYPSSAQMWTAKFDQLDREAEMTLRVVALRDPDDAFDVCVFQKSEEDLYHEELKLEEEGSVYPQHSYHHDGRLSEAGDAESFHGDDHYHAFGGTVPNEVIEAADTRSASIAPSNVSYRQHYHTRRTSRSVQYAPSVAPSRTTIRRGLSEEPDETQQVVQIFCTPPAEYRLIGGGFSAPSRVIVATGPNRESSAWGVRAQTHPLLTSYAIGIRRFFSPTPRGQRTMESEHRAPARMDVSPASPLAATQPNSPVPPDAGSPPPVEDGPPTPVAVSESDEDEDPLAHEPQQMKIRLGKGRWLLDLGAPFGDMAFDFGSCGEQDRAASARFMDFDPAARVNPSKAPPSLWMSMRKPINAEEMGRAKRRYCSTDKTVVMPRKARAGAKK